MKKQFVDGYGAASGRKDKLATLGLVAVCIVALVVTIVVAGVVVNVGNTDTDTAKNQVTIETAEEDTIVVENPEDEELVAEETAPVAAEPITFAPPCDGTLLKEFSVEMPIYSETLDDWRIHSGIDISAPLGAEVRAVADGIVSDMYDDMRNGLTIVVDHEGGIRSIYSNLAELDTVQISENVKKGDVISSVGDTTLFETVADTHLHFEILAEGKAVNPLKYFELSQ